MAGTGRAMATNFGGPASLYLRAPADNGVGDQRGTRVGHQNHHSHRRQYRPYTLLRGGPSLVLVISKQGPSNREVLQQQAGSMRVSSAAMRFCGPQHFHAHAVMSFQSCRLAWQQHIVRIPLVTWPCNDSPSFGRRRSGQRIPLAARSDTTDEHNHLPCAYAKRLSFSATGPYWPARARRHLPRLLPR